MTVDALEELKRRAAATYNAAADFYDHPINAFWDRYGRRTVTRLALAPGARVLDVCCGSGASALPAAEAVGPNGYVLGVDLADKLLELARVKAKQRGLENVEFRAGDMLALGLGPASFDAVICVFGIFFVPDMRRAVRELWSLVRPGGQLAITTWGPRFFEPVNTAFWEAVSTARPDLYKAFNPWDRISEPGALREILVSAGMPPADVIAEEGLHVLRSAEDWWPMVLGTGYRGTIEQLGTEARESVRQECLDFIRAGSVRSVEANVVYAVGTKGPGQHPPRP
jgi:ubiquinone/menaquinone biosynthesis C-methylase UbiE